MKITIWIGSSLLACAFLVVGTGKLFASPGDLEQLAHDVPVALLKIAGAAEVLGAIGLVVPAATRIVPVLTPIAATGLVRLDPCAGEPRSDRSGRDRLVPTAAR